MARKSDDWTSVPPIVALSGHTDFTEIVDAATTVGSDQAIAWQIKEFNGITGVLRGVVAVPGGTIVVTGGGSAASDTYMFLFGNRQVFTVDASGRAKNGVSKGHPAGEESLITIFDTGVLGM